jgi:DNA uptake protein ComE-like DNA-binding protein
MVLIIVMVVVLMLSLAGLSFVLNMQTEDKAARVQGRQLQLEHVVSSGVERVKAFCEQSWIERQEAGGAWDNADLFRDVLVLNDEATGRRLLFSAVSPQGESAEASGWRFGLENESAKLNLGAVLNWEQREPGAAQRALLALPGMTNAIADAILDWLDPDDAPRLLGAETEHYQGLGVPYGTRNGVPQCLEELLLVRDVTRELIFGPQADQLDVLAREGTFGSGGRRTTAGMPSGAPWASLLTVCSAERNQTLDGRPRININQDNLADLRQQLAAAFDPAWADFVVLYRQLGAYQGSEPPNVTSPQVNQSLPAKVRIDSLLDLVGAKVRLNAADASPAEIVSSPWTTDPFALREALPKLLAAVTTTPDPVLVGQVNINLAPRPVLLAVPGIDAALADRVLAARGQRGQREDAGSYFPTWLLAEGLVDLPTMKGLLPYVTGGGDVVRTQLVGYDERSGPAMRVEVVIDASHKPPRQIYWKDLRLLSSGGERGIFGGQGPEPSLPSASRRAGR